MRHRTTAFSLIALGMVAVGGIWGVSHNRHAHELAAITPGSGTPAPAVCGGTDTDCLLKRLEQEGAAVTEDHWRDQTLRETAKLYAAKGQTDRAIALLDKITSPDTRALTIRGIGMSMARLGWPAERNTPVFAALRAATDKIDHAPSHAIALTYIAMAQAYAKEDDGAFSTARDTTNPALRNKAFGESAEIQAERGDVKAAMHSLSAVDDAGYKDKQANIVSKVLADRGAYDDAVTIANMIEKPYPRSQAILYIAAKQITPGETDLGEKE